jgi:hypothetical protein
VSEAILVPIQLDAEVVESDGTLFPPPHTGAPFRDGDEPLPAGVHLHWALPDGLTKGAVDPDDQLRFPAVPDLWVVVRLGPERDPDGRRSTQAWLVDAWNETRTPLSQASVPLAAPDRPRLTAVGKLVDGVLDPDAAPAGWELDAAYYRASRRRFGFHDTPDLSNGGVSYLVIGWYSSDADDPIASSPTPALRARELGFAVDGLPLFDLSVPTMAHLSEVQTPLRKVTLRPPRELGEDPKVVREITGPEAQKQASEAVRSLLERGLKAGGHAVEARNGALKAGVRAVELATRALGAIPPVSAVIGTPPSTTKAWTFCHGATFEVGGSPAATLFKSAQLAQANQSGGPTLFTASSLSEGVKKAFADVGGPGGPELLALLQQGLAEGLAKGQSTRTIADNLYDAGFLAAAAPPVKSWTAVVYDVGDPRIGPGALDSALPDGGAFYVRDRRRAPEKALPHGVGKASLAQLRLDLAKLLPPAVLVLEERLEPSPRWYSASAPAVILRGAGRSYRHGDDGRFDKDGLLRCRRGHEIISGMSFAIVGQESALQVTPDDIVSTQLAAFLPAAVRALLGEAALRDPASAPRIAQIKPPPPGVPPKYDGTLPPSFALTSWTPLFCPLFAECTYTFTSAGGAPLPTIEERALLGTVLSASLSSALTRLDSLLGQGLAYTQLAAAAATMFRLDLLSFTLPALQASLAAAGLGVREGELNITRARVVDTFGKTREIPLQAAQSTAALPRAVAAPARLACRFVDASLPPSASLAEAGPLVSPIAGYLLPDPVEHALEVFDQGGAHLGQLRHSADTVLQVIAEGPPGAAQTFASALGAARPALQALAAALQAKPGPTDSESPVSALIRVIDTTRFTVLGAEGSSSYEELFLGRPVVLLRARLTLEGPPGATAKVTLGCLSQLDDGLLGYLVYEGSGDAARWSGLRAIHPVVVEKTIHLGSLDFDSDAAMADANLKRIGSSWVSVDAGGLTLTVGTPVDLLLLLDGRLGFNLLSDELPRKYLRPPEAFSDEIVKALSPSLRAGPVLVDPTALSVPSPPLASRHVTWIQRGAAGPEESELTPFARSLGALPDKLMSVREGWLEVRPSPDEH